LTKIHESFYRNSIDKIENFKLPLKGELTVVISKKKTKHTLLTNEDIKKEVLKYLKKYSVKDVVELISKKENLSKKKVYQLCLEMKKNENKI
jgi:16S rRNA (cytidine1402-2'-O)-methyltransferase